MVVKPIMNVLALILLSSFVLGIECNSTPIGGCEITKTTNFNNENYNLPNGITISNSNLILNCNGASIIGNGFNTGVTINDWLSNVSIINCKISNYNKGLSIGSSSQKNIIRENTLDNNTYGIYSSAHFEDTGYYHDIAKCYTSSNNLIDSNTISDGEYGVYFEFTTRSLARNSCSEAVHSSSIRSNIFSKTSYGLFMKTGNIEAKNNISNNVFKESRSADIYLGTRNNKIWDNDFNSSIIINRYSSNEFCNENKKNRVMDESMNRPCDCTIPEENLIIDKNTSLCNGTYNSSITFNSGNLALNCEETILTKGASDSGIEISPSGIIIKDCNLQNYTYGIRMNPWSADNLIEGNILFNNNYSIYASAIFEDTGYYHDIPKCYTSSNNQIISNKITKGQYGIMFESVERALSRGSCSVAVHDSEIKHNNLTNISDYAIYLKPRNIYSNNNLTENNLINNKVGAFIGTFNNSIIGNNIQTNNYGIISESNGHRVSYNKFIDNINYSYYHQYTKNQSAIENYWGYEEYNNVSDKVYDFYDNSNLGILEFEPFLTKNYDISITPDNIFFEKLNNQDMVKVRIDKIRSEILTKITIYQIRDGNILSQKEYISGSKNNNLEVSTDLNLKKGDRIKVNVESDIDVNPINNFAEKIYSDLPHYTISSELYPNVANELVVDFIKNSIQSAYYLNNKDFADIIVHIGKRENNNMITNQITINNLGWGSTGNSLVVGKTSCQKPYCGLLGSFSSNGKTHIVIYGNGIEGDIAAVKQFVKKESQFMNLESSYIIDEKDIDAIGVFDYVHTPINEFNFNKNNQEFKSIISKSLNGRYDHINYTIKTSNEESVMLRLEQIKPTNSEKWLSVKRSYAKPIVFSGGIFSNIAAWYENDGLAKQMAEDGKEVWLIEITGGPGTECDSCPDYTYEDLVDYYWPASIAGIMYYSGFNQINYVGHSNGCRTALSSLNSYSSSGKENAGYAYDQNTKEYDINYDLPSQPVDQFVGVGCPGTLNDDSYVKRIVTYIKDGEYIGNLGILSLNTSSKMHITQGEYSKEITWMGHILYYIEKVFNQYSKISLSLQNFYNQLYINSESELELENIEIKSCLIIGGNLNSIGIGQKNDDDAVPISDILLLNHKLNCNKFKIYPETHSSLLKSKVVKNRIMEELK